MPNTSSNTLNTSTLPAYIGRFAPSPSGELHFGSLVSALASYLDAHSQQGQWLVRMEDLDPPREQAGAATAILQSLEDHGLEWHGSVLYQSQRLKHYADCLAQLQAQHLVYACDCTRQDLMAMQGIYDGRCRTKTVNPLYAHALRLKMYDIPNHLAKLTNDDYLTFNDAIQGQQRQNLRIDIGDQILKRKDGLFAYQLAVVVDDIAQNITHIIRGSDLLEVSARQIYLFRLLQAPAPQFGHVTLAVHANGQKLSKQNKAPALLAAHASANLWQALAFLKQKPPLELKGSRPRELLNWAKQHWQLSNIQDLSAII